MAYARSPPLSLPPPTLALPYYCPIHQPFCHTLSCSHGTLHLVVIDTKVKSKTTTKKHSSGKPGSTFERYPIDVSFPVNLRPPFTRQKFISKSNHQTYMPMIGWGIQDAVALPLFMLFIMQQLTALKNKTKQNKKFIYLTKISERLFPFFSPHSRTDTKKNDEPFIKRRNPYNETKSQKSSPNIDVRTRRGEEEESG